MGDGTLGLKRHTVRLVEHDLGWDHAYAEAALEVAAVVGTAAAAIEHVGSTAILGLPAKPILDIAVGVHDPRTTEEVAGRLVGIGYIDRGYGAGSIGRLLVRESAPDVRTIHVHVVKHGTEDWGDYVSFRDALLNDPVARAQYGKLKRALAKRFSDDRRSYTSGKKAFIRAVLDGRSPAA